MPPAIVAHPKLAQLEQFDVAADERKRLLIDQAQATLDDGVRKLVTDWLRGVQPYFPPNNGRWSLGHIRREATPIRHATEQLAHDLASLYMQVARQTRRLAFASAYSSVKAAAEARNAPVPDARLTLADAKPGRAMTEAVLPKEARAEPRPVARALVLKDGRIYVLVWPNGQVQLPGGGLEAGETHEQAAVRETQEEAGLRIVVERWLCSMNDQHATREFYVARLTRAREAESVARITEAMHIDTDGDRVVDVQCVPCADAVALLSSPYDKAAVQTYLNNLDNVQEAFSPAQPRDDHGRWTGEGEAHALGQSRQRVAALVGHIPSGQDPSGWQNTAQSIAQLQADAQEVAPMLRDIVDGAAAQVGGASNYGPDDLHILKDGKELGTKVAERTSMYDGSTRRAVASIADAVRGTIIIDDPRDMIKARNAVEQRVKAADGEIGFDNKFTAWRTSGYGAIHADTRLPLAHGGWIQAEIQLQLRGVHDGTTSSPKELAHMVYKQPVSGTPERHAANREQRAIFKVAYDKILARYG